MSFREYAHYKKRMSINSPVREYIKGNVLHEGREGVPEISSPDELGGLIPETSDHIYSTKDPINPISITLDRVHPDVLKDWEHVIWPGNHISYFTGTSKLGNIRGLDTTRVNNHLIVHPGYSQFEDHGLSPRARLTHRRQVYNLVDALLTSHGLVNDRPELIDDLRDYGQKLSLPEIHNENKDINKTFMYTVAHRLNNIYHNILSRGDNVDMDNISSFLEHAEKRTPEEKIIDNALLHHLLAGK